MMVCYFLYLGQFTILIFTGYLLLSALTPYLYMFESRQGCWLLSGEEYTERRWFYSVALSDLK